MCLSLPGYRKGFVHLPKENMDKKRKRKRERENKERKVEEVEERESMSGCHQTRLAARRERTWLAWSRSGTLGAAMRVGASISVEAGPRPSPRTKMCSVFIVCVCVLVSSCVSVSGDPKDGEFCSRRCCC